MHVSAASEHTHVHTNTPWLSSTNKNTFTSIILAVNTNTLCMSVVHINSAVVLEHTLYGTITNS